MGFIKRIIRKTIYGHKSTSNDFINHLRKIGCLIGEGVVFYSPTSTTVDETRPYLIEIGNNVQISRGVTILTHGFEWSVLKDIYGEVLGSSGRVKIGSNVFIGVNSTILKGVTIGDNVIIGANSLINKDVPNGVVCAGNPCKIICTIDDYYKKRKMSQFNEAKQLVNSYRERMGKEPKLDELREFFWLFCDANDNIPDAFKKVNQIGMNLETTWEAFANNKKQFNNY